jgi:hypothetical protein
MTIVFAVSTDRRDWEWRPRMFRSPWHAVFAWWGLEIRRSR